MSDKKILNKNPRNIFEFSKVIFKILYLYAQEMIGLKNKNLLRYQIDQWQYLRNL